MSYELAHMGISFDFPITRYSLFNHCSEFYSNEDSIFLDSFAVPGHHPAHAVLNRNNGGRRTTAKFILVEMMELRRQHITAERVKR